MNSKKLYIPILLGTMRKGRESEKVAALMKNKLQSHPEIETELIDPRTLNLPYKDEGDDPSIVDARWRDVMDRADGLIIVTPEYNRSFPGSLKLTLDNLNKVYMHKAVGLVGVSLGGLGGARAVQQLLPVVRELGLVATFRDLYFSKVQEQFNEEGHLIDEAGFDKRLEKFLEELVWMAKTLYWGRENLDS